MEKNGTAFLLSIIFNVLIYTAAYRRKSVQLKTSNICVRKSEMFKITGITLTVIKVSVMQGAECSQITVFKRN